MKTRSARLVFALTAVMMVATTQPALAQGPTGQAPAKVQEDDPASVGEGEDLLYGLAPRQSDADGTPGTAEVVFDLPDGCTAELSTQSLKCDGRASEVSVAAVDKNGESVATKIGVAETGITVQLASEATAADGVVIAPFIAAESNQDQLEDATDSMESMLVNAATSSVGIMGAIARPSKITVPSNYVYNPRTTVRRALHDYCTWSPDSYGQAVKGTGRNYVTLRADFKGPCARHDMCIERIIFDGGTLTSKRSQRRYCDTIFRARLEQNCSYTFYESRSSSARAACYARASLYYSVVSQKTNSWNGK
ncbi:hypothetical protein [Arthrobacter sp.]|uniref:hypothetical protein n=1 Tax=Arthrobacter sp. TaxID=1667 RepID=UPI003A8D705E